MTSEAADLRRAVQADLDGIIALNGQVQRLHADMLPDEFRAEPDPAQVAQFLHEAVSGDRGIVLVAETRAGLIGYLWAEEQAAREGLFRRQQPRLMLHHLVVDRAHRRRGVGRRLLRAAFEEADARGLGAVVLETYSMNETAARFFAGAGFAPHRVMMIRRGDEESEDR
ncbi:MAG: GNAT family N-acetyltransferase [Pseudomonadota bacterium]